MRQYKRKCNHIFKCSKALDYPRSTKNIPVRPIVLIRGAVTYQLVKELAIIHKPLIKKTKHNDENTKHLVEYIKNIKLEEEQCTISHDILSLYILISIDPALEIIQNNLEHDGEPEGNKNLPEQIITLTKFCL